MVLHICQFINALLLISLAGRLTRFAFDQLSFHTARRIRALTRGSEHDLTSAKNLKSVSSGFTLKDSFFIYNIGREQTMQRDSGHSAVKLWHGRIGSGDTGNARLTNSRPCEDVRKIL